MNTNHTPGKLPWKTVESGSIYDADFHHLGHFPEGEHAKLAVESVNHYPALLAALEGLASNSMVESIRERIGTNQDCWDDEDGRFVGALETALDVIRRVRS